MSLFRTYLILRRFRKNLWMKADELKELQDSKLRFIVKHAYDNVRFYHRQLTEAHIKPSDIRTVEDLGKLPITHRADLQKARLEDIISAGTDLAKCATYVSSGSTGIPIKVICDRRTEEYRAAVFGRPFLESGLSVFDRMIRITDQENARPRWYERLGILGKQCVTPLTPIDKATSAIERYRPDVLYGHSSYLFLLAEYARQELMGATYSPRLVFGTADTLTKKMRETIDSVFSVNMLEFYGSVEVERIGWECHSHSGYHLDVDSVAVEFVDGNSEPVAPGERGRILVTAFHNYSMPFIRYDLGDSGVLGDEKCSCGRVLPLMKSIEGRVDDYLISTQGRMIAPTAFLAVFDYIEGIQQFRIVQDRKDRITVHVVKSDKFSPTTIAQITNAVKSLAGEEFMVDVKLVESIERTRSGKTRVVERMV